MRILLLFSPLGKTFEISRLFSIFVVLITFFNLASHQRKIYSTPKLMIFYHRNLVWINKFSFLISDSWLCIIRSYLLWLSHRCLCSWILENSFCKNVQWNYFDGVKNNIQFNELWFSRFYYYDNVTTMCHNRLKSMIKYSLI